MRQLSSYNEKDCISLRIRTSFLFKAYLMGIGLMKWTTASPDIAVSALSNFNGIKIWL